MLKSRWVFTSSCSLVTKMRRERLCVWPRLLHGFWIPLRVMGKGTQGYGYGLLNADPQSPSTLGIPARSEYYSTAYVLY
jgi:hypothetical protein